MGADLDDCTHTSQTYKNCHPAKLVYAKNVKSWLFFQERNATKHDWLAWFHKSKDKARDHRSYAEVVTAKNIIPPILPSIDKCVSRPRNGNPNQIKTLRLERHKQQSPVKNQNVTCSKNFVANTAKPLKNSKASFQLNLINRFAPLQDMGSLPVHSNATTTPQPNSTHPTSPPNSRVPPKKSSNKNHLPHNHDNNFSAGLPLHHKDYQDSLQGKQEKIPPEIFINKNHCVDKMALNLALYL